MAQGCPPGVFCIENASITYLIISILAIVAVLYTINNNKSINDKISIKHDRNNSLDYAVNSSNIMSESVLMNPYTPPLKDMRYILDSTRGDPRGVPINISTRGSESEYRQVGLLTRINGKETILPLMGRPLSTNRDKWQFYTMSDKNNSIKLPVTNAGKSCTGEYGCNNVYNGDSIYVEGYNDAFKVTMYDNAIMKYIPFI
jgi:hypothetical protein